MSVVQCLRHSYDAVKKVCSQLSPAAQSGEPPSTSGLQSLPMSPLSMVVSAADWQLPPVVLPVVEVPVVVVVPVVPVVDAALVPVVEVPVVVVDVGAWP